MTTNTPIAVLLDFDGTLTNVDVGHMIMDEFAAPDWESIEEGWPENGASFRELLEREYALLPSDRERDIEQFARNRAQVRMGAVELVRFCVENGIAVEIVSGGLTNYIDPLLEHFGIPRVPVSALTGDFGHGEHMVTTYPKGVVICEESGACKCARVWHNKEAGRKVVFAGDGASDFCVAKEADVLFARGTLADHCRATGIPFTAFDSLLPVLDAVQELAQSSRPPSAL
jgi:2-hydroxy-3-keto-5-methylthiopentenyl-1-phosphate phosphatase